MEKIITKSLKNFLDLELRQVMQNYETFRLELAKSGLQSKELAEALSEELIWENRIKYIKGLMKDQKIVKAKKQNEQVDLGSRFSYLAQGREGSAVLDGSGYFKAGKRIISCHSALGRELLGKKAGDVFKVANVEFRLLAVDYPW